MINSLLQLEIKLSPKYQELKNQSHQLSHFTRVAEHFYEVAEVMNALELSHCGQRCQIVLDQALQYMFPPQYQKCMATAVGNFIVALARIDGLWVAKAMDTILSLLSKKALLGRSINIEVLYTVLQMKSSLPAISFNTLVEATNQILKLIKSSSELPLRVSLGRFLWLLIEEGVCSKEAIRIEIIKYTLKFCLTDKSENMRLQGMQALLELLKKDVAIIQNYESMMEVTIKTLSVAEEPSRLMTLTIEVYGYLLRFQIESERNTVHQQLMKKQDKKNQVIALQPLTSKEYVSKLFQNFGDSLIRSQKTNTVICAWEKCLSFEVEKHGSVIVRGTFEVLVNFVQNTQVDLHNFRCCIHVCNLLLQKLGVQQLRDILDYLLEKIKNIPRLNGDHLMIAKLLLSGVKTISDNLGPLLLSERLVRPNQFIDSVGSAVSISSAIGPLISIKSPLSISCIPDFIEAVRYFFIQNPRWQQNIISILLNISTIYAADLGVGPQEPQQIERTQNLLRGHALCLARLLDDVDVEVHSVPLEIGLQLWNTSRSMVIGQFDMQGPKRIQAVAPDNVFQKETGWMVLSELIMIGFICSMVRLKDLLQLVQEAMTLLPSGKQYSSTQEYDLYIKGLGRITQVLYGILVGPLVKFLNEVMQKFISQTLVLIYQNMVKCNIKVDRMNPQLMICKFYLFRALSTLPPKTYSSHINTLVQLSVDDVLITGSSWEDLQEEQLNNAFSHEPQDELSTALAAIEFFGHIMISKSFTLKNKVNLLGYLSANIQTILASKDQQKAFKLIPYLLIVRSVQEKLLVNPLEVPDDELFVTTLLQCVEACAGLSNSRVVKRLVGQTVAQHLELKSPFVNRSKVLKSLLQAQTMQGSTAYITAELMLRPAQDQEDSLLLQNLFVRLSSQMSSLTEDVLYMLATVSQIESPIIIQLLRGTFMFQAFNQMSVLSDWALSQQIKCLVGYFKNTRLPLKDQIHQNTYLNTLVGNTKFLCLQEGKQLELVQLDYVINQDSTNVLSLFQQLQRVDSDRRWDLLPVMEQCLSDYVTLIPLLNQELRKQPTPKIKAFQSIFIKLLNKSLKSLNPHQQVELISPLILEEFLPPQEQQESQSVKRSGGALAVGLMNEDEHESQQKVENHRRLRYLLMVRASKILGLYRPQSDSPEHIIQTANTAFTFLFKVTSLPIETLRNEAYISFYKLFKALRGFSETGVIDTEPSLLSAFVAQTDAVVSETLKREEHNSPNTNILNLKLTAKIFAMVVQSDPIVAKKMINNLFRGLLRTQQSKLEPSQFYSEKAMVLIMLHRIKALCKILTQLGSTQNIMQFFSTEQIDLLNNNVLAILQDLFVITCCQRPQIKQFEQFHVIHNGNRCSYDSIQFFTLLPHVLRVWALLLPLTNAQNQALVVSLICFTLTHSSPLEILQCQGESPMEPPTVNQLRSLQTLLMVLPHLSISSIDGCSELLPLALQLSSNVELKPTVCRIFCILAGISSFVRGNGQQLAIYLNYLLENDPSQKKEIIQSLVNLALNYGIEIERIRYLVWQYLKQEDEYSTIIQLCSSLRQMQDQDPDYMIIDISRQLILRDPSPQNVKLIAQIYTMLDYPEVIQQIDCYVQGNICQLQDQVNLISFIQVAKSIMAQSRQLDLAFIGIISPSIASVCLNCIKLHSQSMELDWNLLVEIMKFLLIIYVISNDQQKYLIPVLQSLLLFVEQAFSHRQDIQQVAQQAIRHVISITDTQTIEACLTNQQEQLKFIVMSVYTQLQNEAQARKMEEEKAKLLQSQQQAGTIKLKMFGRQ